MICVFKKKIRHIARCVKIKLLIGIVFDHGLRLAKFLYIV